MRANPNIQLRKRRCAQFKSGAAADEGENRPQVTSVVLYFVRVRIPHTDHHNQKSARAVEYFTLISPN